MNKNIYPFPVEPMDDGRLKANGELIDEGLARRAREAGWTRDGGQWRGPGPHDLLPYL